MHRPDCASAQYHPRLVFPLLDFIISKLATSEISIIKVDSVAEQADLGMTLSETPKTGFVASRPV